MNANLRVAVQALHKERFAAMNRIDVLRRAGPPAQDTGKHLQVLGIEHHIARLDAVIRNVEWLAASASNQGEQAT